MQLSGLISNIARTYAVTGIMLSLDYRSDIASFSPDINFCPKCQHILNQCHSRQRFTPDPPKHYSLRDHLASAETCRMCRLFIRSFVEKGNSLEELKAKCGDRQAQQLVSMPTSFESDDRTEIRCISINWDDFSDTLWASVSAVRATGTVLPLICSRSQQILF